jgi:glutaredoxin
MAELKEIVDAEENKVFLFTKEGCVFCVQALEVFAGLGVTTVVADIAAVDPAVKAALAPADGAALTMPQVFVGGKRVGGCGELLAEQECRGRSSGDCLRRTSSCPLTGRPPS